MSEKLLKDIKDLPTIPAESAKAYHEYMGFLVEEVNKNMSSRKELATLIGKNPLNIMFDNHKNHAAFMSNVFYFNNYYLLVRMVPWVYRTYYNHGFSYEYFPAHLRVWQQLIEKYFSSHIGNPLFKVYEWLLSHHQDFISLAHETAFLEIDIDPQWKEIFQKFLQALLEGDRQKSLSISQEQVNTAKDLQNFYLQIIQPAMYKIGEMWEKGEISVAKEHLASALVNRIMSIQYLQVMNEVKQSLGKALVTAAANEFHEIGAQMVANSLEADGWNVEYLGANTPNMELIDYVWNNQPFILAISVAVPFNLERVQEIIKKIQDWPIENRPQIMLGGLAFNNFPSLPNSIGASGYAEDCIQAVGLARKWWEKHIG